MSEEQSFSEWLKERRHEAGMGQQELADFLVANDYWPFSRAAIRTKHVDPSSSPGPYETLRKIELGPHFKSYRPPSAHAARALARWQGVPARDIPDFVSRARRGRAPHTKTTLRNAGRDRLRGGKLFGRDMDIQAVTRLVETPEYALITLVGPPGVGKTQLAVNVSSEVELQFADGVLFVDLAPMSDPDLVLSTIARSLGVDEVGGQPIMQALKGYLRNRQMLLILDNFEQVVKATGNVLELLNAGTGVKLMVTSRQSLNVAGERIYPVSTLLTPDPQQLPPLEELAQFPAIQLFAERVAAKAHNFEVNEENAQPVAELCYHLDGLPLAIELVASRLRYLTPQELLEGVAKWLDLAAEESAEGDHRHRSLRSAIEWSYDLLSESEQLVFQCLSIFRGGCSLSAAESVSAALGEMQERFPTLLRSLIDKSLIKHQTVVGKSRYVMLETLREYGLERLDANGNLLRVGNAHMAYFFQRSIEVQPKYGSAERDALLRYIDTEQDNFRAALRWAIDHDEQECACMMSGGLAPYWYFRNRFTEAHTWLKEALDLTDDTVVTPGRALAFFSLGLVLRPQSRLEEARPALEKSVGLWTALLERATDPLDRGRITWYLAFAQLIRGLVALNQYDEAAHSFELTSLDLFTQTQDPYGQALANVYLGSFELQEASDARAAKPYFTRALELYLTINDAWGLACAYEGLGRIRVREGDVSGALELLRKALDYSRQSEDKTIITWVLSGLGFASIRDKNVQDSITYLREGVGISLEINDEVTTAAFLEHGILLADLNEDWPRAALLYGAREKIQSRHSSEIPPVNESDLADAVEQARNQLGDEEWDKLRARGQVMTLEEAASYIGGLPSTP
jgi:non-specific serine/threonine protein kinase